MPTDIADIQHDLAGLDPESRQIVLDTLGLVRKRLLPKEKILELL